MRKYKQYEKFRKYDEPGLCDEDIYPELDDEDE